MKTEKFIIQHSKQSEEPKEVSTDTPVTGDVLMVFDVAKTNTFFMVESIKDTPGGTQVDVSEITKTAAYNRESNMGFQCFTVTLTNKALGQIKFFKLEN